uniref:SFRICE_022241 n=1 Tax=Spodoptera frugiperda TaxID=7108 RepID=A0A2H1WK54_SPOFR
MCVSCGGRGGSARSPHVLHAAGRARGALPAAADGAALLPRGQL